jgi:hypothetical protein
MEEFIGPQSIGLVGAMLLVITAGAKGVWQFRFQTDKELSAKDALIAQLQEQIREQRAGSDARLAEMREERNEWKDIALTAADLGKRVTNIAEKSVH